MIETKFDIVDYAANGLTGYTFERKQVEYAVMARGLQDVNDFSELSQQDIDLLTADLLKIIYTTPTQTASQTDSHGDFTKTRGSQYISDKKQIYEWMMALYKKWGENPFPTDAELEGGCSWIDERDW
jgi:hypothetical protein